MSTNSIIRSLSLLAIFSGGVAATLGNDRSIINAATANAVDALESDVALSRIDSKLTVADFLKKAGGRKQLMNVLQRAEEVGGPRYSADGQACQVQVQISGDRVARELVSIAASNPKQSPIPADLLSRELADWRSRVFSGAGSSVSGGSVRFVKPVVAAQEDAWSGVSDVDRQRAVDAARQSAVRLVFDGMSPIPFVAGQTVGSIMTNRSVADPVDAWLSSRPVRQVRFTAQREVELTLWTPPSELCDQILLAAHQAKIELPNPADEALFRQRIETLPGESVGHAAVPMTSTTSAAVYAVDLPARPPAWVDEQIVGEGVSEPRSSKLKAARAAESAARESMRKQINALRLSETLTVGEAAERSPSIDQAVTRCVNGSRPFKVEYRADGSVLVRSTINLRGLWASISER